MNFMFYDLTLLGIFVLLIFIFLYRRRRKLKREGLLLLYRTNKGIKFINRVGKKHKKLWNFLSYVSVGLGYGLMIVMLYFLYTIVRVYAFRPDIVQTIKIPPIMPLIPYLPKIFNLPWLPPFYFTYWIIIIAVIAITHEFAHGIFAAHNNVKIKKTGFGFFPFFLPIFLAAFVELDEKKMAKKKKFKQMSILSAGTFANILTAVFVFGLLWLFFSIAFIPSGVAFERYAYTPIPIASISSINSIAINNASYEQVLDLVNETGLNEIETIENENYLLTKDFLKEQRNVKEYVLLYYDSPAINAGLEGAITEINDIKIDSIEKLSGELLSKSPGEEITIKTKTEEDILEYEIVLGEHPENKSLPWLGIGFGKTSEGSMNKVASKLSFFRKSEIYYLSRFGNASIFIYHLLWWLLLISLSVALVNMLPVGIFDGGKFFYLTVLAITKKEEKAKNVLKFMSLFILFLFFLLIFFWLWSFR